MSVKTRGWETGDGGRGESEAVTQREKEAAQQRGGGRWGCVWHRLLVGDHGQSRAANGGREAGRENSENRKD
jgi:hypothetical protein